MFLLPPDIHFLETIIPHYEKRIQAAKTANELNFLTDRIIILENSLRLKLN